MSKCFAIFIVLLSAKCADAQMTAPQKLYQLCKVWGYLKYHHPNNCAIKWNNLLVEKVDSVIASGSTSAFGAILYNMCLQAGITSRPATPNVIPGDTARNYNTAWFNDPLLPTDIRAYLDSVEAHRIPNTSGCMLRANNYQDPNYTSYIDFRYDSIRNIPGFSYTNLKHRMLVYFYYWNVINYLAPQLQIADHNWDSTLIQFMPDMINAGTDSAFELTLARVVSMIDDSHGFYSSKYYVKYITGIDFTTQYVYRSKLVIARIENKHVVTASGEPNITSGDIISKIDGIDADTFLERWKPYFSEGNIITKYRDMYSMLTYGSGNSVRHLELIDRSNNTKQVNLYATATGTQYSSWFSSSVDTLPEWTISKCGFGYVNMGKLTSADVPTMYQALKGAPAIVFDVRNYPQGTMWDLKTLLFGSPNISARLFAPDLSYPGYYFTGNDLYNFGSWQNDSPFAGRVIILVNEQTQSQAEYTVQVLRTLPKAIVIGSQTAGADGNISYLDLPNIKTYWTSMGWFEHDWYNPQRAGVRIDSIVHPTVAGLRQGIDEVMIKAFDCSLGVTPVSSQGAFTIAQGEHNLTINSGANAAFDVQLLNMLGQQVLKRGGSYGSATINIDGLKTGIYAIVVTDKNGAYKKTKIYIQ